MEEKKSKPDFLVLGLGLAGASLALKLAMKGHSVAVLVDPEAASASEKAVGLVNPVTGRRMARTWNFEEIFSGAFTFYKAAFGYLFPDREGNFLEEKPIFKALHSIEEINFLTGKSASQGYDNLLDIRTSDPLLPEVFKSTLAWCRISNGGRMETLPFLNAVKDHFRSLGRLIESNFRKEDLIWEPDGWNYRGIRPKQVISCLGNGCPWKSGELWPVKGQVYELSGLPNWGDSILKTEKFLVPTQSGTVLAGSTYERSFDHMEPDPMGFEEITSDLLPEIKQKIRIEASWAGSRPTTKDRRPIIEKLSEGLFALNGLGAKGVTLAPWSADELIAMMKEELR